MKAIDIEKLNQLISRTDISGNDKVRWLTDFIDGREFQQQEQDKKMYSEEEVLNFTQTMIMQYKFGNTNIEQMDLLKETLQLFKNK